MTNYRLLRGLLLSILLSPNAHAAGFGCEGVAGAVIFKDSLYGMATGALLSGLYAWSKNNDKDYDSEKLITNTSTVGGLLGLGLGIAEITLRECNDSRRGGETKRWNFSLAALPSRELGGFGSAGSIVFHF